MNESLVNLLKRAADLKRRGRRVVGCLLVKARGSTPQAAGALMLVDEDADTHGTVGGGCVEAEVRRQAHAMLAERRSGLLRFKLDHDYGWDDGLICGGTIEMAVGELPDADAIDRIVAAIDARQATELILEIKSGDDAQAFSLDIPPRERLLIAGAGHVGQALARTALRLDFEVALFDDRADLLRRFAPEGCLAVEGDIAERMRRWPVDDRTYAVIVTRGHRHDEQALHAAVGRGAAYVGMIGSRRKVKLIFDDLAALGVPREELDRVHAPIGLDIGSITVEEIAVSIAAQLVQARRRTSPDAARSPVRCPQALAEESTIACGVTRGG